MKDSRHELATELWICLIKTLKEYLFMTIKMCGKINSKVMLSKLFHFSCQILFHTEENYCKSMSILSNRVCGYGFALMSLMQSSICCCYYFHCFNEKTRFTLRHFTVRSLSTTNISDREIAKLNWFSILFAKVISLFGSLSEKKLQ